MTTYRNDVIPVLTSIRGIAALIVVAWHFASVFLPAIITGNTLTQHSKIDIIIYQTPLSIFFAGNFAVVLFFVLSGFVLTQRFFRQDSAKTLFSAAFKRYFRLMPLVLVSTLIAYTVMSVGAIYAKPVGNISGSIWAKSEYYTFSPKLVEAVQQGFLGVFTGQVSSSLNYNPVLWTIYYEFLGSILIFGIATMVKGYSKRWLFYLIIFLAFINTYFSAFIAGLILADTYSSKHGWYVLLAKMRKIYKISLLAFGISIAGFPYFGDVQHIGKFWQSLLIFENNINLSRTVIQIVASMIVIVLALSWGRLKNILESKPLLFIGNISYPLYAVHFILIYSLSSYIFLKAIDYFTYTSSVLIAVAMTIPVMLWSAYLLNKYLEIPLMRIVAKIGKWAEDK
jgi:peptidoglycan/LPS O-acetylase OafA/YrhL